MKFFGWNHVAAPCLALVAFSFPAHSNGHTITLLAQAPVQDVKSPAQWRERLTNSDLDQREGEFESLVESARVSSELRAQLQEWSKDLEDCEFAWTCRLALREVDRNRRTDPASGLSGDPLEDLHRQLLSDRKGLGSISGFMRAPAIRGMTLGPGITARSEQFQLELRPDGVKARVTRDVNGEQQEQVYSASTIEELLKAHPELSEHVQGGAGVAVTRLRLPGFEIEPRFSAGPRTDVLGVYVSEPSDVAGDPSGLRIMGVQSGSVAERLGLARGQTLTSLNGRPLLTRDDISAALRERAPERSIDVELRDVDGTLSTRTWHPAKDGRGKALPLQLPSSAGKRGI